MSCSRKPGRGEAIVKATAGAACVYTTFVNLCTKLYILNARGKQCDKEHLVSE